MNESDKPRRYPDRETQAAIRVASGDTCCICREHNRAIQLHHIDGDRSNADPGNFAVLCLECHNRTLVRGGFGRQLTPKVVRAYRDEWLAEMRRRLREEPVPVPAAGGPALVDFSGAHSVEDILFEDVEMEEGVALFRARDVDRIKNVRHKRVTQRPRKKDH